MSKWQPIETAPKDGTRVLLHHHFHNPEPDDATPAIGAWEEDFWGEMSWCMEAGDVWPGATHWMVLPEPPDTST